MKRLGVAAMIRSGHHILLGRRGKDPNRGLYVLPGGGVEDNESLENALRREIKEETGLDIESDKNRWLHPYIIELSDRVIMVVDVSVKRRNDYYDAPVSGGDLYDVAWFPLDSLPSDMSPVIMPTLVNAGLMPRNKLANNAV